MSIDPYSLVVYDVVKMARVVPSISKSRVVKGRVGRRTRSRRGVKIRSWNPSRYLPKDNIRRGVLPLVELKRFEWRSPTLRKVIRSPIRMKDVLKCPKNKSRMSPDTEDRLASKMKKLFGESPITSKVQEVVDEDIEKLYYSPVKVNDVVTPKSKSSAVSEQLVDWVQEMEELLWGSSPEEDVGIKPLGVISPINNPRLTDGNLSDEEGVSRIISLVTDKLNNVPGKLLIS